MKYILRKIFLKALVLPVASAGIFFLCGFARRLPADVTAYGVNVGGMTCSSACAAVRGKITEQLKDKKLTVEGRQRNYVFSYPEISFRDNLPRLLSTAVKGDDIQPEITYFLNGLNEIASAICFDESVERKEPSATFTKLGEPFIYDDGRDGLAVDYKALVNDINCSLNGGFCKVQIKYAPLPRKTSPEEVRAATVPLSSFTTYFDGENINRAGNIRLAAALINGYVLNPGETFSFNAAVGARTESRGFLPAKIIEKGEYVQGVGGGVCQVSTTLFNAAVLCGCLISEFHPHSLAVGYAPPSRDAMVSGDYFDLKFVNTSGSPLYIRGETGENYVTFRVYGKSDGAKYYFVSSVVETCPPPVEYTSDPACVQEGREGVKSEGYLVTERDGKRESILFRKDEYSPLKRVEISPEQQKTG